MFARKPKLIFKKGVRRMSDEEKKIENPWCLHGGFVGWRGLGKIIEEGEDYLLIVYSEKDLEKNEWHPWIPYYVKRFVSLKEAVKEYARHKGWSFAKVKEKALEDFPSENI
ncbi:MAG: hypothetical protein Q8O21_00385 [bacterium]|nr:hypothetical protein [bacterium]